MLEFTGERVIPGLVDPDLFNEHVSRYRFAASFVTPGMIVLDAGCGAGYGTAELAHARFAAGIDICPEAVEYAAKNYARGNIHFAAASCSGLPFADEAFDLIAAFEVIEHLPDYRLLLSESRRVLKRGGILLVSTPNRAWYGESRAKAGPNPFHIREFDCAEFGEALAGFFPHVEIWTQNHTDAIVFAPAVPETAIAESGPGGDIETAHFFVAACSDQPISRKHLFAWIPAVANTLREREIHIARLESELSTKNAWLEDALARHEALERTHQSVLTELERSNRWAEHLNQEIARRDARIAELQDEVAERLAWVRDLEKQISDGSREIERLNSEIAARRAELEEIAQSRWIRLGRKLNVGPEVNAG